MILQTKNGAYEVDYLYKEDGFADGFYLVGVQSRTNGFRIEVKYKSVLDRDIVFSDIIENGYNYESYNGEEMYNELY